MDNSKANPTELWKSLQKAIDNQLAELDAAREALRKEKEEFNETKKKISSVHFQEGVKLNIGGKVFKTTLQTLRKEDSMLSRMFSGSGFSVTKDEDGCYFIDRPGKPFGPILHYLQTGTFLPPKDENALNAIKMEVNFYQIPFLVEYFNKIYIQSNILTTESQKVHLAKMLNSKLNWKLILDSQTGGQSAETFDSCVKGKSNILVVIQATTGFIFGAFVADKFGPGEASGWISGSTETFLWTLRNNNHPIKLTYKKSSGASSGHFSSCGLHLGNRNGELVAFCSHGCQSPNAFKNVAPGYETTLPIDQNLLAGSVAWTPARMEVFELSQN
eukprot:TRINITY_DN1337_c0_g6_i1.p1 TRINITY_DN1337_c0_g6~~TRINITY_DN1337_c0_g6_i1.p1  ORF type:complete len:330 (-),score=49.88 TRINITY_DN1337_c0_g6_i1:13-1002(-)